MYSIRKRAPGASSPLIRRVMQSVRRHDTAAELQLRKTLFQLGLRYRLNAIPVTKIRCKADVVFRSALVCIFIDGCYWHGCPKHFRVPKTNASWWSEKIADNRQRDRRQSRALRRNGWIVLRFWEHEVTRHLDRCLKRIVSAIQRSRARKSNLRKTITILRPSKGLKRPTCPSPTASKK
jgi:DNA mismatch endonuclease, patch repair protein